MNVRLFVCALFAMPFLHLNAEISEDKLASLVDILGSVAENTAKREGVEIRRLDGSSSSVHNRSYMAVYPYRLRRSGDSRRFVILRESFLKSLAKDVLEKIDKLDLEVNYAVDWPYEEGISSGRIRLKTKKGLKPPFAAMIDMRLFSDSGDTAFVTVTYHVMYLLDENLVPNLEPDPSRDKCSPLLRGKALSHESASGKGSPAGTGESPNNSGSPPRQPWEGQPPAKPDSAPK